jgi:D-alanyl-D-alanine carboxypeptidase/D-alanyl-D-alanine-endopeptidase (penicillin-binding protein 4)
MERMSDRSFPSRPWALSQSLALIVGAFILLTSSRSAGASTPLPAPVAQVARAMKVPESSVSVWVQRIGDAQPRVAVNADTPRNPASVMKLVTSFAALEALGPAYTWKTEFHLAQPLRPDGSTDELWVRGGGDPFLVLEEHWRMLGALRERGLTRIERGLVFDVSAFDLPPEDPGAFDGQPDRIYNITPHPLLVNFNAVRFRIQARTQGGVEVAAVPALPNLRIDNRLQRGAGACGGFQNGVVFAVRDDARRDNAVLEGRFPAACREYELSRTVLQPESYAWGLFDLQWRQQGGELKGGWRVGVLPADIGTPFHVHRSRPLGEIIRSVNKSSNNVMTRHLELALGRERYGSPATPTKGQRAILDVLRERGVDTRGIVIGNSAGLSREGRITARQLAAILGAAWDSSYMPEYASSLALAGLDGTMRNRFRNSPATGRMHIKTGRLDDVSAVAGYVTAASGQRFLAVVLVNAPDAHRGSGEELQDALLQWVHDRH